MITPISINDAKSQYGITTNHEEIDDTELRFRLVSNDGSAYIRTVACDKGRWQKSHFHKAVRETYIVQQGWMAMASLRNGNLLVNRYEVGEMVTTEPYIRHNIYLPAHAIIHTVKHGHADKNDKFEAPDLDVLTKNITEEYLMKIKNTSRPARPTSWPAKYSEDYRHFDNLIWQVPAWSTAIFAAVLSGYVYIYSSSASELTKATGLSTGLLGNILLFSAMVFFASIYYTVYRWRVHQRYTKRDSAPRPLFEWAGAQLFLQFVTGLQLVSVIWLLSLTLLARYSVALTLFCLIIPTFTAEVFLHRHKNHAAMLRKNSESSTP